MNLLHCIAHSLPRLLHYTADLILNIELNYMFTRDQVMTITYRAPPRPSSPVRRRPPTHSESSLEELDGSISSGDSERRRRLLRDLPGARLPCNSQQSQIWRPSTGDTLKPKALTDGAFFLPLRLRVAHGCCGQIPGQRMALDLPHKQRLHIAFT